MPKPAFLFHWAIAASVLVVAAGGCEDNSNAVYPVTGKIIFEDGSNAQFGNIEFRSQSDSRFIGRGKIEKDGTFQIRTRGKNGAVAGSHQAVIIMVVGTPRDGGRIIHNHGLEVANKYRSYDTTDLVVKVEPDGQNHFELLVESK